MTSSRKCAGAENNFLFMFPNTPVISNNFITEGLADEGQFSISIPLRQLRMWLLCFSRLTLWQAQQLQQACEESYAGVLYMCPHTYTHTHTHTHTHKRETHTYTHVHELLVYQTFTYEALRCKSMFGKECLQTRKHVFTTPWAGAAFASNANLCLAPHPES